MRLTRRGAHAHPVRFQNSATARSCRVRTGKPGILVLELVRRDAFAAVIPALQVPAVSDLKALPVGRREDGSVHDPAAWHAFAGGRVYRGGEGLVSVGAGAGHAARDGRRAGAGARV